MPDFSDKVQGIQTAPIPSLSHRAVSYILYRVRTHSMIYSAELMIQDLQKMYHQSTLHALALGVLNELDITDRLLGSNASFGFGIYLCAFVRRVVPILGSSACGQLAFRVLLLAVANV